MHHNGIPKCSIMVWMFLERGIAGMVKVHRSWPYFLNEFGHIPARCLKKLEKAAWS